MGGVYRILAILFLCCTGCSPSPVEPILVPIIRASTFEQQIEVLDEPFKVAMFMQALVVYDVKYNLHWYEHDPDMATALAKSLYNEYHGGKCRGACGQMAAFYIVAAREHGFPCGAVIYYGQTSGHVIGWIQERDGSISTTSNQDYGRHAYENVDEFKTVWRTNLKKSSKLYGFFVDEYFDIQEFLP